VKTTTGNRGSQAFFHHLVTCEPYLHSYGPLPVVGQYMTSFGHLWNVKYHRDTVIDTWGQQKKESFKPSTTEPHRNHSNNYVGL